MNKVVNQSKAANLRQRAENHLKNQPERINFTDSEVDSSQLINELRLHQIELEMQNDELQTAKAEVQKIAKKYTLLYNFATSALLTINQQSEIIELNISAAQLLGRSRLSLKNSRFGFLSLMKPSWFSTIFSVRFLSAEPKKVTRLR